MWYVNYQVWDKEFQAGPYPTFEIAEEHAWDIADYIGVSQCFVSNQRDEKRPLMHA